MEQTAILVRYVDVTENETPPLQVEERLLCFNDCSKNVKKAIFIMNTLKRYEIPLEKCKCQNCKVVYSPYTCHSLNLCGEQAAESCPAAITFLGAVQKVFNLFSLAPKYGIY